MALSNPAVLVTIVDPAEVAFHEQVFKWAAAVLAEDFEWLREIEIDVRFTRLSRDLAGDEYRGAIDWLTRRGLPLPDIGLRSGELPEERRGGFFTRRRRAGEAS